MDKYFYILIGIFCVIFVINEVRKNNFSIVESFFWLCGSIVILILSIFPNIINLLAKIFNIHYPPSLLFILSIIFLLFINFRNSKKIAVNNEKIIELGQRIAILDEKLNSKAVKSNEKK